MLKYAWTYRWRADGGTAQSALSKVRALSAAGHQRREEKQELAGPSATASMRDALMVPPRKRFGQRMGQFEDAERKPKVRRDHPACQCGSSTGVLH